MPCLFRDAILITRRLGLQYLWIDSLCIIQDSLDDWVSESSRMGHIFKDATITIAAEAAPNSSRGLFESTDEYRDMTFVEIKSHSTLLGVRGKLLLGESYMDHILSRGPLSGRAWTLQEELLSCRVLRFTKQQVWWQCREQQWSENFPDGDGDHNVPSSKWSTDRELLLTLNGAKIKGMSEKHRIAYFQPRQCWYWTVNEYCRRRITDSKDILPAISGIAKEYGRHLKQEYKAGLWRDDVHLGLLWSNSKLRAVKASTYVAPSWSWASLRIPDSDESFPEYGGPEIYDPELLNYPPTRCEAKIICINVTKQDQDSFGRVKAGFLKIDGPCHESCHCNIPHSFLDCYRKGQGPLLDYQTLRRGYHFTEGDMPLCEACTVNNLNLQQCQQDDAGSALQCALTLLHIASHSGFLFALVLERCNDGAEYYRRVGLAILRNTTETASKWPTRTVTII